MAEQADGQDEEAAEQWELVNTPLGEKWSGRARYAAAMYFYKRDEMSAETLEVYRICARLDSENPLPIIRDRAVGKEWLKRMGYDQ
ncbi:hypothetical protein EN829_024260 [Mesorhizobium sp. M00.F.Ca.ET.186.01.1.1]|nr:hypothetical protein EN848_19325 [bacterium M00.F.Ca.ET.205.01.1.1]TGU51894.1 hypothetical protein EN795_18875 [bacterium M00.F.Ca.ET.152.01.1.1]TGV33292.1 hypothetical protein EN829_024260 [Mesorhizobium sp. M00.F.Ca.ET.186.01.1.1]TGZ42433.1 hypothetical protein EN805_14605 [bacterium M00.F.Ca.ET.162.01.1.1]TIW60716.1 MAG: hypothetical protein E5V48_12360 [Mesorhizobium sp.]